MDIFADTADIEEIKKLNDLGIIDGVTTNPTLIAKSGRDLREVLAEKGMQLIEDIRIIYENYEFDTRILTASARGPKHILDAAKIGSDVVTAPPKAIWQMLQHPLTDKGLKAFLDDWEKTGQTLGQVG